jgi:putative hemolysin
MNPGVLLTGVLLLLGNALFVMAEYGLLSVRQTRLQSLASQGNRNAKFVLAALKDRNRYVAGIQIGITLFGIALGALVEPALSSFIEAGLDKLPDWTLVENLPDWAISTFSIVLVTYPLVVLGELVPKYLTLVNPERAALGLILPLRLWVAVVKPLIWLFDQSAGVILRLKGIDPAALEDETLSRSELQMVVQASEDAGAFDEEHADVVLKALRLDRLTAKDIMIHRLDMDCLQADLSGEALIEALQLIRHSRLPAYGADMDDILGVIYLQDVLKHWGSPGLNLKSLLRPAKFVPENLSLDRALSIMRETRTQILLVQDEYGGTKGMLTLEDIVEEILGDLQDGLEAERPEVEQVTPTRLRLSPYVRWDQILDFLDEPIHEHSSTDAIATMVTNELERIPVQGDSIETHLGRLVVEQITRSRIVQMGLYLSQPFPRPSSSGDEHQD